MNIFKITPQNCSKLVNKLWKFIKNCLTIQESLVQKRIKFYENETEKIGVEKLSKNEWTKKIEEKIKQYQTFLNSIIEKSGIIPEKYENTCISTVDIDNNEELTLKNIEKRSLNELLADSQIIESTVSKYDSCDENDITHLAMALTEGLNVSKESSEYSNVIITLFDKSSIVISSIKKEIDKYKRERELHSRTLDKLSNQTGPKLNTVATQSNTTDQNIKINTKYKKHMESVVQKLKIKIKSMEKKITELYKNNIKNEEATSVLCLENVIKDLECQQIVFKDKYSKLVEENNNLNEKIKDIGTLKHKLKTIESEVCSAQESLKISNEENQCLNNKIQLLLDRNNELKNKVCLNSMDCQTDITEDELLGDILLTSEIGHLEL